MIFWLFDFKFWFWNLILHLHLKVLTPLESSVAVLYNSNSNINTNIKEKLQKLQPGFKRSLSSRWSGRWQINVQLKSSSIHKINTHMVGLNLSSINLFFFIVHFVMGKEGDTVLVMSLCLWLQSSGELHYYTTTLLHCTTK